MGGNPPFHRLTTKLSHSVLFLFDNLFDFLYQCAHVRTAVLRKKTEWSMRV
jgi:hypothetical protein